MSDSKSFSYGRRKCPSLSQIKILTAEWKVEFTPSLMTYFQFDGWKFIFRSTFDIEFDSEEPSSCLIRFDW